MNKSNLKSVFTMIGADVEIDGSVNLKEGIIIYGQIHYRYLIYRWTYI